MVSGPSAIRGLKIGGHLSRRRLLLIPSSLVAVLAISLVLAAGANAALLVGEGTAPELSSISPEADIRAGKAEYDTVAGKARFTVTTAAVPLAEVGGVPSKYALVAALVDTTAGCNLASIELGNLTFPYLRLAAKYQNPSGTASLFMESGKVVELEGSVSKSVIGATTTLEFASPQAVDGGYNCAALLTESETSSLKYVLFPIAVLPPPPPPAEPTLPGSSGPTSSTPAPAPAPPGAAILSIAKRKPLTLKVGKWKTVKLTVTNTGTAGTGTGSLRVKVPKGVSVKPKKQRLPALAPGKSWTVSIRVRLTEKAKEKSTLSLTAAASGATSVRGSLVVKLKK